MSAVPPSPATQNTLVLSFPGRLPFRLRTFRRRAHAGNKGRGACHGKRNGRQVEDAGENGGRQADARRAHGGDGIRTHDLCDETPEYSPRASGAERVAAFKEFFTGQLPPSPLLYHASPLTPIQRVAPSTVPDFISATVLKRQGLQIRKAESATPETYNVICKQRSCAV